MLFASVMYGIDKLHAYTRVRVLSPKFSLIGSLDSTTTFAFVRTQCANDKDTSSQERG